MSRHIAKSDTQERVLFNQNEPTQALYSDEINVTDRPVLVTHWNAAEGEFLCLMKFDLSGCLEDVNNMTKNSVFVKDHNCNYICLCCKCNTMKITEPGRYKLVKRGILNNAQVTYRYLAQRFDGNGC